MESKPGAPKIEQFPGPTVALEDVKTPEDFLKAVDFKTLNNIFDDIAKKSNDGKPISNSGHRVTPDHTTFAGSEKYLEPEVRGGANVHDGRIYLKWDDSEEGLDRTFRMLEILMHEATHVRGGSKSESWEKVPNEHDENYEYGYRVRHGLTEKGGVWNSRGSRDGRIGLSLSEAVTETIAVEAFKEYVRRTGELAALQGTALLQEGTSQAYFMDRIALAVVITALARELAVDQDAVWRGIVHAYMEGNTEVEDLLNGMAEAMQDNQGVIHVLMALASDRSLDESEMLDMEAIITALESSAERVSAIDFMRSSFSKEQFKNALKLH